MNNIIDATQIFRNKKKSLKKDISESLLNDAAFISYCECIGELTKQIIEASDYHDEKACSDMMFSYETNEVVDVTMTESVKTTAQKLAKDLMAECANSDIKIFIESIRFQKLLVNSPKKVSLTMRIGSVLA